MPSTFSRCRIACVVSVLLSAVTLLWTDVSLAQQSIFDPEWKVGAGPDGPVYAVLVRPNGSLLVGGEFTNFNGHPSPFLARLNPDGSLDTSFQTGTDGVVNRLLPLSDGKVFVGGGFSHLQGIPRRALGRLDAQENVDPSFDPADAYDTNESVITACVDSNGAITTASFALVDYSYKHRLTRLDSEGNLDQAFTRQAADFFVYALLPMPDGKTLVGGGFTKIGSVKQKSLLMVDQAGGFDPVVPSLFTNYSTVFSLKQLTNGNILVTGLLTNSSAGYKVLAQLTPDWRWDTNFAPVYVDYGFARDALVQPDGKILVTGSFSQIQGHWRRHIARVDAAGIVDPCFNPTLGLGGNDGAHSLALQSDGRVVVGGQFDNTHWGGYSHIARLLPKTDSSIIRLYVLGDESDSALIGCCPAGGTNHVQISTNLVDWTTVESHKEPYFLVYSLKVANSFFRIMREP